MKNNWLKEACIIAVAIIVLGFFLKCGIDNFVNKDRIVSVKGLAEVEVPANKVIWPIVFSEMGNDLPALYNRINSTAGKVTDYLKNNGIMESDISAGAPKAVDLQAERYVSQQKPYILPTPSFRTTACIPMPAAQASSAPIPMWSC